MPSQVSGSAAGAASTPAFCCAIHESTAALSLMSTPSRCMACIIAVAGPQLDGSITASAKSGSTSSSSRSMARSVAAVIAPVSAR